MNNQQSNVNKICDSIAHCTPPDIQPRAQSAAVNYCFQPIADSEARHILANCPTKSVSLGSHTDLVIETTFSSVHSNYMQPSQNCRKREREPIVRVGIIYGTERLNAL